jgi:hypothetical protein
MEDSKASNSLVIADSKYLLFRSSPEETAASIKVNMGGAGLDLSTLPRIKIPSGGGLAFEVPTLEGTEPSKTVEGVICYFNDFRTYWEDSEAQGTPPDCSSEDMDQGRGDPGGACGVCPMSQWGSGKNGTGQACATKRKLLIVPSDRSLPIMIDAPPTSLKSVKAYFQNLASFSTRFYHVMSEFSLEADKTDKGVKYSKLNVKMSRKLTDKEREIMNLYVASIEATISGGN